MAGLCGNLGITLLQHSVGVLWLSLLLSIEAVVIDLEIGPQNSELPGTVPVGEVSSPCMGGGTVAQKTLVDLFPF